MGHLATTYQHIADILSFEVENSILEKALSKSTFDWDAIVVEASRDLVLPAIYCRLESKQLLHVLPEELNNYLKEITALNRKRNQIILAQTQAIAQLFNKHGINYVFLKGAALLALGMYEDIAERMIGDIDVLVHPDQLAQAFQLLIAEDYVSFEQTLSKDFFEHKHLPRLKTPISNERIAAVEIHRKLFSSYHFAPLRSDSILKDKRQVGTVYIPSQEHLLMHNILNFQINDDGALYNNINFRTTYDTILLQQRYTGPKDWYETKVFKKHFRYANLFFKDLNKAIDVKTNISTYFYLFKLKHLTFYKYWNKLLRLCQLIPLFLNRLGLFLSNRRYRKAIIQDRNRIFNHFTSLLKKI